ncbi:hypothetical protein [Flavobacterium sp.]|uniref:hypothetical protein n=1 Tax=Flavobacterium sp. TaxID=239 RepID=UPI0026161D21|nr:hypothetical protein [Flavobacterium sp.]
MSEIDWTDIKHEFSLLLNLFAKNLDEPSLNEIEHFIKHDEYEMAFELLFLELFNKENLPHFDHKKVKNIALLLKVDQETVYDTDFWITFSKFINQIESQNNNE